MQALGKGCEEDRTKRNEPVPIASVLASLLPVFGSGGGLISVETVLKEDAVVGMS